MSISRGFSSSVIGLALSLVIAACGAGASTDASLPTFSPATATLPENSSPASTPDAGRIWLEQPFGAEDTLAVFFYTDPAGQACIRYMVSVLGAQPVSSCPSSSSATLVAVQGIETTRQGEAYSIIVGRVFSNQPTVVSVQLTDGESFPVPLDEGGFILILPGRRTAFQAVPIDQYGNTVGGIFSFR